jgi:hypothetical protein
MQWEARMIADLHMAINRIEVMQIERKNSIGK